MVGGFVRVEVPRLLKLRANNSLALRVNSLSFTFVGFWVNPNLAGNPEVLSIRHGERSTWRHELFWFSLCVILVEGSGVAGWGAICWERE